MLLSRYFKKWGCSAIVLTVVFISLHSIASAQGGIKGKIRSNRGSGIPNATVTARQNGKDIRTTTSDTKGTFQLSGLESGVYSIVFDADGFTSGLLQGVEVKNGGLRDLGDRLILFPDQGTLIIVNGSIFYREGTSLGGAKVEIERETSEGSFKKLSTVYTTPRGEFTFKMPQESAKLRITARFKSATGSKEIVVGTAAIYRLAITLDISRTEK